MEFNAKNFSDFLLIIYSPKYSCEGQLFFMDLNFGDWNWLGDEVKTFKFGFEGFLGVKKLSLSLLLHAFIFCIEFSVIFYRK